MEYNPEEISYQELLEIFFENHSPEYKAPTRQYASAIFYHDANQKEIAQQALEDMARKVGRKLFTEMLPYEKLFIAEAYHQKYYMKLVEVLKTDIKKYYPSATDFMNSTAAARINGYAKGLGTTEQLNEEIEELGLSERGRKRLAEIVDSYS